MGWRPRMIVPATAMITFSEDLRSVVSVKEKWDISLLEMIVRQFMPRFWDMLHVFCTPSPEYPPIKSLSRVGKVSFVELPETVVMETRWSGSAKYPGPPLLAVPGFSLFGFLKTSNPNKDPYYTSLPVEVQSGTYTDASGEEMKRSSWFYHVPTALQHEVMDRARAETVFPLLDLDGPEEEDDEEYVKDYQTQTTDENLNVMNCVKGGAARGENVQFDADMMRDFEAKEKKEYRYLLQPKRVVAQVEVTGEATPEKISEALKLIRAAVASDGRKVFGKEVRMRNKSFDGSSSDPTQPLLGLQLWSCKACFNMKGEPAMAVYEMQYGYRLTTVQVELEML